jgi:DnaK suppressor protein
VYLQPNPIRLHLLGPDGPYNGEVNTMARQDALLRLHKTLVGRRAELRKRLGKDLEDLARLKHSSASGDAADAAFDASGEELASTMAELESKELA